MEMSNHLHIEVVSSKSLSDTDKRTIISLCARAYGEDFESLFNTFADSMHVLGYYDQSLVSHAMWVTRWLQVGTNPLMRTAYIEAVATEKTYRTRGFATAVMKRAAEEIQDFNLGALSPFSVAYYERLGWELWRGPLFIRTDKELMRTPRDGDIMILQLPRTPALDLNASLSAEWREGELG